MSARGTIAEAIRQWEMNGKRRPLEDVVYEHLQRSGHLKGTS